MCDIRVAFFARKRCNALFLRRSARRVRKRGEKLVFLGFGAARRKNRMSVLKMCCCSKNLPVNFFWNLRHRDQRVEKGCFWGSHLSGKVYFATLKNRIAFSERRGSPVRKSKQTPRRRRPAGRKIVRKSRKMRFWKISTLKFSENAPDKSMSERGSDARSLVAQ